MEYNGYMIWKIEVINKGMMAFAIYAGVMKRQAMKLVALVEAAGCAKGLYVKGHVEAFDC